MYCLYIFFPPYLNITLHIKTRWLFDIGVITTQRKNLANGEMTLHRTKHIDALSKHSGIRYHWIRELIIAELIELKHVSSLNNESDLFTKPLGSTIHKRLKTKVMNKKTDENEPTKETSSNFSVNYKFTTSIDDELKSLIFTNGI